MSKGFQEGLIQGETRWSVDSLTAGPLVCLGGSPLSEQQLCIQAALHISGNVLH